MSKIISVAVMVASFLAGILLYRVMPAEMAAHWNAVGEVNGTMPKFWGLFLMPMASAILYILYLAIPRIDPLKANIGKFRKYFDRFIALLMLFLLYIYALTLLWNLGVPFDMVRLLVPAFAVLFYSMGALMQKAEPNWFIGIRTPWTLSHPAVWRDTHRLGGRLFKLVAVISLLGLLFRDWAITLTIGPVIIVALYTVVYSYVRYKKEVHR